MSIRRMVRATIPAFGCDVPDIVGGLVDPIARFLLCTRPTVALVGVPWHARIDDYGRRKGGVSLHPREDLRVVVRGAAEPGVGAGYGDSNQR